MKNYQAANISFAEALINTYDTFLDEPEHLRSPTDLRDFLLTHEIEVRATPTTEELETIRALRETLRALWNAEGAAQTIQGLNRLFANLSAIPHLSIDHNNTVTLQLNASPLASLVERVTLAGARSLMAQLQGYGHERLRACAAEPCRDVFVDTSRNRTRRFCSDRCANRYNVAAFRERKKSEGG